MTVPVARFLGKRATSLVNRERTSENMSIEGFRTFGTWVEVIAWVELEGVLYYKAPLDLMPRRIRVERKGSAVKVSPLSGGEFDAFLADEGHLSRFMAHDQAPSSDVDPPEAATVVENRAR